MSDSESENENFCYFGKPLEPYDEDSIPRKRPVSVEEQIATDAQGRRRFHGAFTGGFSAGFFNTVNTLEGWTPSDFKSSRSEKAQNNVQKPEDFMDEEDLGQFGIAPQVVKATNDYNTSRKRKKQIFSDGPIPGEPVLHNILSSGNETIGYMLLKNLGIKDKIKRQEDELTSSCEGKVYGCQMPKPYEISKDLIYDNNKYEIPTIYKEFFLKPKDNTFGLGYAGLDKDRFSLFPVQKSSKLVITDKNNKKMSITGQAFGVGAFEEEDDDIYMKEDMSKYDFELIGEKEKTKLLKNNKKLVFDTFLRSNKLLLNREVYPPPQIPHSFTGKHKVRRSRFEPVQEEKPSEIVTKINPTIRAKYLGEESEKEHTESKSLSSTKKENKSEDLSSIQTCSSTSNTFDVSSLYLNDRFVLSSKEEDVTNILEPVKKMDITHGTEQMREAARMKMFGLLTRETFDWVPSGLLCKRFNVPEPFVSQPEKSRTRSKNIIFEYQKHKEQELKLPDVKKEEEPCETIEIIEENRENVEKNEGNIVEVKAKPEIVVIKDITEKIGVENQQDLFKAVFLSSDSESENEEAQDKKLEEHSNRKEELKSTVLSDQLISKIKPLKEGILSSINFHKFSKPTTNVAEQQQQMQPPDNEVIVESEDTDLYGPKIPDNVSLPKEKRDVIALSSDSEDEWVEKDSTQKKKHKKDKKHKKHKHKKDSHKKKRKDKDNS